MTSALLKKAGSQRRSDDDDLYSCAESRQSEGTGVPPDTHLRHLPDFCQIFLEWGPNCLPMSNKAEPRHGASFQSLNACSRP